MNVVRTFLSFRRSCSEDPKMSGSFAYFCLSECETDEKTHRIDFSPLCGVPVTLILVLSLSY